jgi:Uma2 family endonuclease
MYYSEPELHTLHPPRTAEFDDAFFFALCQANENLALERDETGKILFMPPTTTETGRYNSDVSGKLWQWNHRTKRGYTFDSSTGFKLPDSSVRSPDVAWIEKSRWDALSADLQETFAPICPDFVIEIRSKSDDLKPLKEKMEKYRNNGCQLGWLIDRAGQQVFIYRENGSIEIKTGPTVELSGEVVLPDLLLTLDL